MRRLLLLAVLATLLTSMAPNGAKADPFEGDGFIWGPNGNWMNMREPFNHGAVFKAISMAVDSNTISQRMLGEPHMLFSVEDASPQAVVAGGTDVFDADNARQLLATDGVTNLTFTIGGDPAVPLTVQLAEAIASDLKTNIGANVRVTSDSNADYIVRKGTQPAAPADLPFTYNCTPNTFRPNLWLPVECDFEITNNGSSAVDNVGPFVDAFGGDIVPWTFEMSETVNGKPVSLDEVPVEYGQTVQPGETLRIVDISLWFFDGEGDGTASWILNAGSKRIAAGGIPYHASAYAPEPQDLEVNRKVGGNEEGKLWYETTITNRGSSTIQDLRLTERYSGNGEFQASTPPAANEQPDVGIATWDLPALGRSSLAPGESVSLETWYIPPLHYDGCPEVDTGMMVETIIDGVSQRYGARTDSNPLGIQPCYPSASDSGAGGDGEGAGAPASLAGAGEGPSAADGDCPLATASLAGIAIALIVAAGAIRLIGPRRMR